MEKLLATMFINPMRGLRAPEGCTDTASNQLTPAPSYPQGLLPVSALHGALDLVPGGISAYGCRYGVVVQKAQRLR